MESEPTKASSQQNAPQNQQNKRGGRGNRGNFRGNYRGGNRGNFRGNFRGNHRGNFRGNYRGNQPYRGNYQMYNNMYPNPNQNMMYYPMAGQNSMAMAQKIIYQTEMYIFTKYKHLLDINTQNKGLSGNINENSMFYVIKSFSEEDVHKSIKYGVWSSSKNGNNTLSNSYKLCKERGGDVYLYFSCNGSGRFVGVAKMTSDVDPNKTFEFWTQDEKWPGLFNVEWKFIKDVPFKEFREIVITMKDGENKPVSNSRDTQEIPYDKAKTMMQIFENYQNTNTILEHFEYYDIRQENYEKQLRASKQQQMNPPSNLPSKPQENI